MRAAVCAALVQCDARANLLHELKVVRLSQSRRIMNHAESHAKKHVMNLKVLQVENLPHVASQTVMAVSQRRRVVQVMMPMTYFLM